MTDLTRTHAQFHFKCRGCGRQWERRVPIEYAKQLREQGVRIWVDHGDGAGETPCASPRMSAMYYAEGVNDPLTGIVS